MNENIQRPVYDERDEEITMTAKSIAWDCVAAATQILTILCVVKGNPAWKGCLALLFLGMAANMASRFDQYGMGPYFWGMVFLGAIGVALFVWFLVTG